MSVVDAPLEVSDLLILTLIEAGLFALLDDTVVQVDTRGKGASDSGDEGCNDEALLYLSLGPVYGYRELLGPTTFSLSSFIIFA